MITHLLTVWGRVSSVGIATCYGVDGPGIESGEGEIFRTSPDRPSGSHCIPHSGDRLFLGVKWPGRGVNHQPASSDKVKERVELHFYSPSGTSWPVLGWILLLIPKYSLLSEETFPT
jgi:hypothetical protein